MTRLSMNEMTTYRWSFEEDVARYRAAGIGAIGVWRQKLSDYGEDKGIELLAESGLTVSNLLWAGGFTGSDGRSFRESVDDGLEAVRLAKAMGAESLVVYSGARAGHTHNHARRLMKDALQDLVIAAAESGVTLALEPMHAVCASEWTFLNTLDDAMSLVDFFDSPHLRLAFDTYHFGWDEGVCQRLRELASRIAIVHLGDGKSPPETEQDRSRLGEGTVPLGEIIAALIAGGYRGWFDVELMGQDIEASNYDDLLRHSRAAFDRLLAGAA
jgi:sugar phosphate isomerase/epimerase